jgi:protein-L-isoaspartate(D-aspartate) O-methyltransferase
MTKPPPRFPLALDRLHARRAAEPPAAPARMTAPAGLGLDSAGVRARMVARLRADGVRHDAVLSAFAQVPRHVFVDSALVTQAYEDTSLPIGHGQTISKPSVVARMLELLFEGANARATGSLGRALEIGTGCGYQAALLCVLSRSVVSVERVRALHDKASADASWRRCRHPAPQARRSSSSTAPSAISSARCTRRCTSSP